MISTITATQKFDAIHPIIKVNATKLYVNRLMNMKDLDTFIDEVSAVLDKKSLFKIYSIATSEPFFSSLYVKLTAKARARCSIIISTPGEQLKIFLQLHENVDFGFYDTLLK